MPLALLVLRGGDRLQPDVELTLRVFFLHPVALLQATEELVSLAGNHVGIVVRELTPLAADGALELLPLSFDLIAVHRRLLFGIMRGTWQSPLCMKSLLRALCQRKLRGFWGRVV